jgi:ABC-type Fe3+/spermidine/putrescine transport system ATPase subunit
MQTLKEPYNEPKAPFVAEFIGTMNRLEATVTEEGDVDFQGTRLRVNDARGHKSGERVLVLVRPETLAVEQSGNGAGLGGEVVAHIFLGATTRVKVDAAGQELSADIPSIRAATLRVGRAGQCDVSGRERPRSGPRRGASVSRSSPGRSLKIPVTPSSASSRILAGSLTVNTSVASPRD